MNQIGVTALIGVAIGYMKTLRRTDTSSDVKPTGLHVNPLQTKYWLRLFVKSIDISMNPP